MTYRLIPDTESCMGKQRESAMQAVAGQFLYQAIEALVDKVFPVG